MAKQIKIKFNDEEYILEYSRNTAKVMERAGFDVNAIGTMPNIQIPLLFQGAFLTHHKRLKEAEINAIWKQLKGKEELITKLAEMYGDTANTLLDEPEGEEGNASWEVC